MPGRARRGGCLSAPRHDDGMGYRRRSRRSAGRRRTRGNDRRCAFPLRQAGIPQSSLRRLWRLESLTGAREGMAVNGAKSGRYEFDETDRRILELLKANGRATNQKIARDLKVSAA